MLAIDTKLLETKDSITYGTRGNMNFMFPVPQRDDIMIGHIFVKFELLTIRMYPWSISCLKTIQFINKKFE